MWSFELPKTRHGLPFPYVNYAPVVWKNYVIDGTSAAHDDLTSRVWCLEIRDGKAELVWQTNEFVPYIEIGKSNLIACDGKLYGADSQGGWDDQRVPGVAVPPGLSQEALEKFAAPAQAKMPPGRPHRPANVGQFQCRDIATGKLLWSTDAIKGLEWTPTFMIAVEDKLIVRNTAGLWICRLRNDGLDVLTHVRSSEGQWNQFRFSEPVLVNGRLYLRDMDASDVKQGLYGVLGAKGNLTCLDLKAR